MDNFDEMEEPVMVSRTGKRKRREPQNSARSRAKNARYSGEGLVPRVTCRHNDTGFCTAGTLNENDLEYIMFTVFMFTVVYSVVLLHFHIINFQRWTYRVLRRNYGWTYRVLQPMSIKDVN